MNIRRAVIILVTLAYLTPIARSADDARDGAPTSYVDDFLGKPRTWVKHSGYELSQADGVLSMKVNKHVKWDGQPLELGGPHDFSAHPCVNLQVRADNPCVLSVYFISGGQVDLVSQRVRAVTDFVTLSYDMSKLNVDLTRVERMILCVNGQASNYAGTVQIKNFRVGQGTALTAGIEGVDDVHYYHDAGRRSLRIFGLSHVSTLTFNGAENLIRDVTFSPIEKGRATMTFECIPGATGTETASITAKGEAPYQDNSITFPVILEPNYPPSIAATDRVVCQVGKPQEVRLTVDDGNDAAEQPLTFSVAGGGAPISAEDATVDWRSGSRYAYVHFTPRQPGECKLEITVDDHGEGNSTARAILSIRAVRDWNNPPTLAEIGAQSVYVGEPDQVVSVSGISDGDSGKQALEITATSSNATVIPDPKIEYTGGPTAKLFLNPSAQTGAATITIKVTDHGGTPENNGDQTIQRRFDVISRARPIYGFSIPFNKDEELRGLRVEANIATSLVHEDGQPAMKISCENKPTFGGIWVPVPALDLIKYPLVSLEIKPVDDLHIDTVLYDGAGRRNNTAHSRVKLTGKQWTTVTLDLSGKGSLEDDQGVPLDGRWINMLLLNFHPELDWPFTNYTGALFVRNLRFGKDAAKGRPEPAVNCSMEPIAAQAFTTRAGKQSLLLRGVTSGSAAKPKVAMRVSGDALLQDVQIGDVDDNGNAMLMFTVNANAGKAEVAVTATADGSAPITQRFNVEVVKDDRASARTVTIDCAKTYQTIRGIGTFYDNLPVGLYANELGGSAVRVSSNGDILLRPDTSDLGTINRNAYNVRMIDFERVRQLKAAGVETFILTSWSPPAWMKPSHSLCEQQDGYSETSDGQKNILDYEYYDEFAKLMVGLVRTFQDESGVELYAIGLQNEPCFHEAYSSAILDPKRFCELVKIVGKRFQKEGIKTRLMYSEHMFNMMNNYIDTLNNDAEAQQYSNIVALHGYDEKGVGEAKLEFNLWTALWNRVQSKGVAKEVWMTETGVPADGWPGALKFATNLYGALEFGNIGLWTSWEAEGSIVNRGKPVINLYAMRQFTKYIRPGALRVASKVDDNDVLATSYVNDASHGGKLVSILINKSAVAKAVVLNATGHETASFHATCTDAIRQSAELPEIKAGEVLVLPPSSVTTTIEK